MQKEAKWKAKKVEKKDEVFVQFAGEEYVVEEVMEKAKGCIDEMLRLG